MFASAVKPFAAEGGAAQFRGCVADGCYRFGTKILLGICTVLVCAHTTLLDGCKEGPDMPPDGSKLVLAAVGHSWVDG